VSSTASTTRRVRPPADSGWNDVVSQEEVVFRVGQTVAHPFLGQGVVARVEGTGADLKLSIDFPGGERKHFLARLAKLTPLD
jgi:hypothetical protein